MNDPDQKHLAFTGHAHAGVYLVLSPFWKWIARIGAPIAAILIPGAFFLSVASPSAAQPNGLMSLGVGLIRAARRMER